MVDALVVASDTPLSQFPRGSVVYVKNSVGPLLFEKLQPRYPAITLKSYSERPESARTDFVKLEVLSAPTQGTMLVAVGTAHAFGQVLLLKFLGKWRVIVDRSYVV